MEAAKRVTTLTNILYEQGNSSAKNFKEHAKILNTKMTGLFHGLRAYLCSARQRDILQTQVRVQKLHSQNVQ